MVEINGIEYRNLEEQVRKNKEDIAAHYNVDRVLADFGIRVLGQKDSADQLPDPETFDGQYGDAYAVGETAPYSFYIWTRANVNDGHPTDYWFDIGQLGIIGPQGPQGLTGPQGETGERGSLWFSGNGIPSSAQNYNVGDQYLNAQNGDVYSLVTEGGSKRWMLQRSIMGPQGITGNTGPQGPQGLTGPQGQTGARGPAGPLVNIVGVLSNVDQLPNPSTLQRQTGYMIPIDGVYHVFIIIGPTGNLQWFDAGIFGTGTIITENGNILSEWDATNVLRTGEANEDVLYDGSGILFQQSESNSLPLLALPAYNGITNYFKPYLGTEYAFGNIGKEVAPSEMLQKCYVPIVKYEDGLLYTGRYTLLNKILKAPEVNPETYPFEEQEDKMYLPKEAAAPRIYVDRVAEYLDDTITAKFKVKCNIVNRTTKTFTLKPDKFYVIHGYGTNKVTIRKKDGSVLISDKNDILCMASSSGSDGKTWHGFIAIGSGTLGVPAINWNGDLLDVGAYAENTSPDSDGGSGNMYVYEFGMFDEDITSP